MAGHLMDGVREWELTVDQQGYREYKVTHFVETDSPDDGPTTVMLTPGLPLPGAPWNFGNDLDPFVWCWPTMRVKPRVDGEKNIYWEVEQIFSNKPLPGGMQRCHDIQIEDPLLEPPIISGGFTTITEEATHDRFGDFLKTSSHEQLRGPQVEFDDSLPHVRIEQNVAVLNLTTLYFMVNTVNSTTMWGFAPRSIKLSNVSWEEKYWGLCFKYYTRVLEFDINPNTFDRDVLDEGTKVLNGHWDAETGNWVLDNIGVLGFAGLGEEPDPDNPQHFIRFKDPNGENAKVILNGAGLPAGVAIGTGTTATTEGSIHIEYYGESNFFILGGIPTVIGV